MSRTPSLPSLRSGPDRRPGPGYLYLVGFAACIPAANGLIQHVGSTCPPDGPCLIPVAPGIMAPSGVLMIGLALVLRDLVQRRLGVYWAIVAILAGAALSAGFAPANLVLASTAAFLISELADLAVYTPLQRRQFLAAVLLSSTVGLLIDSLVFLAIAFGHLDYLPGQVLGKAWMVLAAMPVLAWLRRRERIGPPRNARA